MAIAENPSSVKLRLTIGRDPTCDIRLADRLVSKVHCSIIWRADGTAWVEDEGSTNGTRLNGARVLGPRRLHSADDEIKIGHSKFTLRDLAELGNAPLEVEA